MDEQHESSGNNKHNHRKPSKHSGTWKRRFREHALSIVYPTDNQSDIRSRFTGVRDGVLETEELQIGAKYLLEIWPEPLDHLDIGPNDGKALFSTIVVDLSHLAFMFERIRLYLHRSSSHSMPSTVGICGEFEGRVIMVRIYDDPLAGDEPTRILMDDGELKVKRVDFEDY